MYVHSQDFRDIINSGSYVYVNGRWVLKSPNCIKVENGVLKTCIASEDLDNYCLSKSQPFGLIPAGTGVPAIRFRDNILLHSYLFKEAEQINSITKINNDNLYLFFGGGQEPPNDFNDAVVYYMESRDLTVEELSGVTGLSEKTIQRMRTKKDANPTLKSIVALSVGLSLSTYQSGLLIHLAGYSLTPKTVDQAYSLCLNMASSSSVEECNYFLIRLGLNPLTNLYDKEKANSLTRLDLFATLKNKRPNTPKEK